MRGRTLAVRWVLAVATAGLLVGPAVAARGADSQPWVWPLDGPHAVSRGFDPPLTPYGPGHRGADLPGRPGQPVRAAGAGRVSYAGLLAGKGVVVVIHGELRSTYEPVSAAVQVGQQVAAGQIIGSLAAGHAGCAGACLHWGLLRGDVYLDPVRLVSTGPSRLLPLDRPATGAVAGSTPAGRSTDAAASPTALKAPAPADRPAFALRAGDAASAGGALVALIAGLVLLRRPPRPPDRPLAPALAAGPVRVDPPPALVEAHAVGLVDLASERHRRRPEVA